MDYRVEDLAAASGVKVDTVRFYQGRGLIAPPRREGRTAIYGEDHLARLRQIRSLLAKGFSLAQIQRLPGSGAPHGDAAAADSETALLAALAQESIGDQRLTRAQLVAEAGIPDALIGAARDAGLLEPSRVDDEEFYSSADAEMLRTGLALISAGLPLAELLDLASTHAGNVRELSERGIDLFDDHIRKGVSDGDDPELVARAFQELLPQVTRLVAVHFQRTLVKRAVDRLREKGEGPALERALEAVEKVGVGGSLA